MDLRYINQEGDQTAQRSAWGAFALYVLIVCLTLYFAQCSSTNEQEQLLSGNTLMINLGASDTGQGELQEATTPTPPPPIPQAQSQIPTEQLTDERSDVEVVNPKPIKAEEQPPAPKTEQKPIPEPEPAPREVNKRALFPGSKTKPTTSSGSTTTPKGQQGSPKGTAGRETTLGDGLIGNYTLSGRTLVGALPIPAYRSNAEGKVVVEITVDDKGVVTSARYRPNGSTTDDVALTRAAREAALKARFTDGKDFLQQGTITYTFKMN